MLSPLCVPAAHLSPLPNFPCVRQSVALVAMSGVFRLLRLPFMFNSVFPEAINHYDFVVLSSRPVDVPKHRLLQIFPTFPSIPVILWDGCVSDVLTLNIPLSGHCVCYLFNYHHLGGCVLSSFHRWEKRETKYLPKMTSKTGIRQPGPRALLLTSGPFLCLSKEHDQVSGEHNPRGWRSP